jgi:hypothetical protein
MKNKIKEEARTAREVLSCEQERGKRKVKPDLETRGAS